MSTPLAIVIGAALIAVAILLVFRWEVAMPGVIRLDRWTGSVVHCTLQGSGQAPEKADCKPK
jgi:hypothetical protein